ncbi:MAG: ABC transporter ATP-binding protein [Bacteroidota bacterium]
MNSISIAVNGLSKDFNRSAVFKDISFSLSSPASLSITGKNGAGKSTLSKILAGVLSATRGSITYSVNEKQIEIEEFKHHIGFVSPYLNLYDEFTALENLQILSRIRTSTHQNNERIEEMLALVELWDRRDDIVSTFSSGMKQRLKYAFALLHNPAVLILDEPTSNLDAEGIEVITQIILEQKKTNILIIATNIKEEANWCAKQIQVGTMQQ